MRLYSTEGSEVTSIREMGFALERDLQTLVEGNLYRLFGLQFIRSEFTIAEMRMDTVAFDAETRAFVIIEFKRATDYSVVDQGVAYLQAMLNHQAASCGQRRNHRDRRLEA